MDIIFIRDRSSPKDLDHERDLICPMSGKVDESEKKRRGPPFFSILADDVCVRDLPESGGGLQAVIACM